MAALPEAPPAVAGFHHVGWLCRRAVIGGPNHEHHWGSWESNRITTRRGDTDECPDCQPVYLPSS